MPPFSGRVTIRDLGYTPGVLPPGPANSILDVSGVHVSQVTVPTSSNLENGSTATKGLTVISPRPPQDYYRPCAAGWHCFNGNGQLTGTPQIADWGFTNTPIALTNSLSLGTVFDGIWDWVLDQQDKEDWDDLSRARNYGTPVVGETADWLVNCDVRNSRLEREHIRNALESMKSSLDGGEVQEGQAGGGAGMTCHQFAGGTGSASRLIGGGGTGGKQYTLGVLCQTNYGHRGDLVIGGVPVGKILQGETADEGSATQGAGVDVHAATRTIECGRTKDGSILVLTITDAPLATHQLQRLARHATAGLAQVGSHGIGRTFSGDIFLALSTAEQGPQQLSVPLKSGLKPTETYSVEVVKNESIDTFFIACAEATEEAILNSLVGGSAGTVGMDGSIVEGLPIEKVRSLLERYHVRV